MKRGRPTSSPDGPKRPYAVKLPADVIAIIRAQPNQAEFLERLVREWTRGQARRRRLRVLLRSFAAGAQRWRVAIPASYEALSAGFDV